MPTDAPFPVTLRSARLTLRELREDDWRDAQVLDADPLVVRYQTNDVLDEAGTRAYLARSMEAARASPRRIWDLAITRTEEDRFLGRVGLDVHRPEHREAELWFTLRRDCHGQGLATEAVTALLDFGFGTVGLHRVYGDCDPRNVPSWRLMERLGLRREAHLRENYWLKGEWCDAFIYAVLEDEWRARRGHGR